MAVLLAGCTSSAAPASPPWVALTEHPECPELTGLAAYAYFCDSAGGISECQQEVSGIAEPSMCDQATSTLHQCDCDSLSTCQTYRDPEGNAAVGCLTAAQQ